MEFLVGKIHLLCKIECNLLVTSVALGVKAAPGSPVCRGGTCMKPGLEEWGPGESLSPEHPFFLPGQIQVDLERKAL
jgi:hypothetical protein